MDGGDGLITGALVEGNVIYNNSAGGGGAVLMDAVQDSTVRNNLLFNNHASGISAYNIGGIAGPKGVQFLHNTVDMPADGRWALEISHSAGPNLIRNNILIHRGFRGGLQFASPTDVAYADSDYNILDRVTPDYGVSFLSLAVWQAQGYEARSFSASPSALFVSPPADYHLRAGSPAIDRGQTLSAVLQDLEGRSRPAGAASDVGCFESGASVTDTTPPAPPAGLSVTPGDRQATAAWNANSEPDLAGYCVYRAGAQSGPYAKQNASALTVRSYTQTGLTNGTTYWYRVSAVDRSGNESALSGAVSATPMAPAFDVTGTVTLNGTGLADVTVTAGGKSALTGAGGGYSLTGLTAGT
jgi:hypothetical protein